MTLPPLPKLPAKEMAGPTPWSNWVIPGQVLAGAYPASMDDAETDKILSMILELGVNTFVCLQAEVNIHTPEHLWRQGHGLRPYIRDAQKILSRAHETNNSKITQQKIDFLHLPIIDGSVTTDSAMNRLVEDCCERVLRGEKMYIHCWGGHGRTGTLVAVMLGRLYNLPYTTALRHTQAYHDSRVYPQGVRSPQTPVQRAQVRRLLSLPSNVYAMAAAAQSSSLSRTTPPLTPTTLGSQMPRYPFSSTLPKRQPPVGESVLDRQPRTPTSPSRGSRPAPGAYSTRRESPLRSSMPESPLRSSYGSGGSGVLDHGSPRSAALSALDRAAYQLGQLHVSPTASLRSAAVGGHSTGGALGLARGAQVRSNSASLLRRSFGQEVNVR